MKIAYITEEYLPQITGVSIHIFEKLKWFAKWGFIIRLYVPDYSLVKDHYPDYEKYVGTVHEGLTIIPFPSQRRSKDPNDLYIEGKPFGNYAIEKDIRQFKPDLIHVDTPERLLISFLSRPGIKTAKKLKIPITAFYHSHMILMINDYKHINFYWYANLPGFIRLAKKLLQFAYNGYDINMVPSLVTHDFLLSSGIHNLHYDILIGVDTDYFKPDGEKPPQSNQTPRIINILNISRYDPDKQVDTLLKICDGINDQIENVHFTFIGFGLEEKKVSSWVDRNSNSVFLGQIPNKDTVKHYNEADIFITAADKENQSVCVLEAMACGLPVIGPDQGGLKGLVDDKKTGFIVKSGSIDEYVSVVTNLAADDQMRREFSLNARQKALLHTNEKAASNMAAIWRNMIEKKGEE